MLPFDLRAAAMAATTAFWSAAGALAALGAVGAEAAGVFLSNFHA